MKEKIRLAFVVVATLALVACGGSVVRRYLYHDAVIKEEWGEVHSRLAWLPARDSRGPSPYELMVWVESSGPDATHCTVRISAVRLKRASGGAASGETILENVEAKGVIDFMSGPLNLAYEDYVAEVDLIHEGDCRPRDSDTAVLRQRRNLVEEQRSLWDEILNIT